MHAGGRGKAGGVKVAKDLDAVRAAAKAMLGTTLVTHQTGAEGLPVQQVYVELGSKIAREIYLSLVLNREAGRIAFVASAAGGMDIEEVAEHIAGEDHPGQCSSDGGPAGFQVPATGVRLGIERRADRVSSGKSRTRCTSCIWSAMPAWWRSIR